MSRKSESSPKRRNIYFKEGPPLQDVTLAADKDLADLPEESLRAALKHLKSGGRVGILSQEPEIPDSLDQDHIIQQIAIYILSAGHRLHVTVSVQWYAAYVLEEILTELGADMTVVTLEGFLPKLGGGFHGVTESETQIAMPETVNGLIEVIEVAQTTILDSSRVAWMQILMALGLEDG